MTPRPASPLARPAGAGALPVAAGLGDSRPSAGARARPPVRQAVAARHQPLLRRCRLGRPGGRRAFDAIRHPRGRALPPGAGARHRDGARLDRPAAGHDRRRRGQDGAGGRRGAHRPVARLSRRAAVAGGAQGRQRGRADRALHGDRPGDAADRLLPADRGRRHCAVARLLGALRRHRQCRGGQGGAVQPLPHARRRRRHRPGPGRGSHHALYRQRRPHRGRSR